MDPISNGLDLIGQHVGGISVVGFRLLPEPSSNQGFDIQSFGYGQLDPATDLHILVAPFYGEPVTPGALGASLIGTGITWIKPDISKSLIGTTAAHETGHSLGYVLADSPQAINAQDNHCSDEHCVMTANATEDPDFLRFKASIGFRVHPDVIKAAKKITDFCTPCKADMHATADENIDRIRRTRRLLRSVTLGRLV